MRPRATAFVVVFLFVASVAAWLQRHEDLPRYGEPSFTIVSGASMMPHRLRGDETIASALSAIPTDDGATPATQPGTLVLVRRGPEGLGRQRIDTDASMKLVDPAKDQSLRNGDQLIISPSAGCDGLQRPPGPGIPVSN